MRKNLALLVAMMLLAGACTVTVTGGASTSTSGETTTTLAPTTTVLAGLPVELTDCSDPPEGFEVLCDTYRLLSEHYVDPVDDARLAEGAGRGIEEFEPEVTEPAPPGRVSCATPSAAFGEVCELFAEQQAEVPVPTADLVEAAVMGMIHYGLDDPNTVYFSPEALESLTENQAGEVSGIGALVRPEDQSSAEGATCSIMSDTCVLIIVATLEGGPAEAEGLQEGDGIVTVDGRDVEGWTVDEVVAQVRGPAGTDVTLGLLRDGVVFETTITRATVVVPVVTWEILEPGVGYVVLSSFTNNSADQVREAFEAALDEGADRFIFDLRNNPGGSLTASIRIASEFLADGDVLRTESPNDSTTYEVRPGGLLTDPEIEIIVLVNRASASASELVSAVLQERGRATILGEATFGKNTVQQRFDVGNGGAVSITIARWVTPGGNDFGVVGVQPDVEPVVPEDADTDVYLEAALELWGG